MKSEIYYPTQQITAGRDLSDFARTSFSPELREIAINESESYCLSVGNQQYLRRAVLYPGRTVLGNGVGFENFNLGSLGRSRIVVGSSSAYLASELVEKAIAVLPNGNTIPIHDFISTEVDIVSSTAHAIAREEQYVAGVYKTKEGKNGIFRFDLRSAAISYETLNKGEALIIAGVSDQGVIYGTKGDSHESLGPLTHLFDSTILDVWRDFNVAAFHWDSGFGFFFPEVDGYSKQTIDCLSPNSELGAGRVKDPDGRWHLVRWNLKGRQAEHEVIDLPTDFEARHVNVLESVRPLGLRPAELRNKYFDFQWTEAKPEAISSNGTVLGSINNDRLEELLPDHRVGIYPPTEQTVVWNREGELSKVEIFDDINLYRPVGITEDDELVVAATKTDRHTGLLAILSPIDKVGVL